MLSMCAKTQLLLLGPYGDLVRFSAPRFLLRKLCKKILNCKYTINLPRMARTSATRTNCPYTYYDANHSLGLPRHFW